MTSKKEKKDNHKKDKKKKDKKSKKSKKSSKHEGDYKHKKRTVSERRPPRNQLSELLSIGMVLFPQLQTDLSGIILALDSGKQFQLLENGDQFNSFLLKIFEQLPLKQMNNIWTKSERSLNLRQIVLHNLLQSEVIGQPNTLLIPETLAMRAAQSFAPLLTKFPSLWKDIIPLLNNFIAGEAVDVSGIEISAIKKGLCSFFHGIGAKKIVDDFTDSNEVESMIFMLPSKSTKGSASKEDVRKAIQYFAELFSFTKEKTAELSIDVAVADVPIAFAETEMSDSASSSDSSSSEEDDEEGDSMRCVRLTQCFTH